MIYLRTRVTIRRRHSQSACSGCCSETVDAAPSLKQTQTRDMGATKCAIARSIVMVMVPDPIFIPVMDLTTTREWLAHPDL